MAWPLHEHGVCMAATEGQAAKSKAEVRLVLGGQWLQPGRGCRLVSSGGLAV
jgi:hypothetical protein